MILHLIATAHGFQLLQSDEGASMQWTQMPVPYQTDAMTDSERAAIEGAFAAWKDTPGAAVDFIVDGTDVVEVANEHDGLNIVYWEDDWQWDADILALTSTWHYPTGEVVGFDIRINDEVEWTTDGSGLDLQTAMTHEVGHALGIDHSDVKSATMFASVDKGELKRHLHWDDEDAARHLYPYMVVDEANVLQLPIACSSTGRGPAALWVILLSTAMVRARRSSDVLVTAGQPESGRLARTRGGPR